MSAPLLNITVDDIYPLDNVIGFMLRTIVRVHDRESCLDLMTSVEELISSGTIAKSLNNISKIITSIEKNDISIPQITDNDNLEEASIPVERFNVLQATVAYSVIRIEVLRAMYSSVTKMKELGMLSEDFKNNGKEDFDRMYTNLISTIGTRLDYKPLLDFGKNISTVFRISVGILHGDSEIQVLTEDNYGFDNMNLIWQMNKLRLIIKDVSDLGELLDYSPDALDKSIVVKDGLEVLLDKNGNEVNVEMVKYLDMQYFLMKYKLIRHNLYDKKIQNFYNTLNNVLDREKMSIVYSEQLEDLEVRISRWSINRSWLRDQFNVGENNLNDNPEEAKRSLEQIIQQHVTLPTQIRTIDDLAIISTSVSKMSNCADIISNVKGINKESVLAVRQRIVDINNVVIKASIKSEIPHFVTVNMTDLLMKSLNKINNIKGSLYDLILNDGITLALGNIRLESDTDTNISTLAELLSVHLEPKVSPKASGIELLVIILFMSLRIDDISRSVVDYDKRDLAYAEFDSILTSTTRHILDNLDRNLFSEIVRYLEGEDYSKANIGFDKFVFLKSIIDINRLINKDNGIISGAYEADNANDHNKTLLLDISEANKLISTLTKTGGTGNIQRS